MIHLEPTSLIIVTGAAGFIGSQIVKELNARGYQRLVLVDDLGQDTRWQNLVGCHFLEMISPKDLFSFLKENKETVRAIIHMGAITDTTFSNVEKLMEDNYRYTLKLIAFATKHAVRFIYASSCSVYGNGAFGFEDDPMKIKEFSPLNPYALSKYLIDCFIVEQKLLHKVTGLRFSNVYGPGEGHKGNMASLVYKMYDQIEKEGSVRLFASETSLVQDGEQRRDFVYVKDVAQVVVDLMGLSVYGIYNLGAGVSRSFNELAKVLFKHVEKAVHINYIPMPENLSKQYQSLTLAPLHRLKEAMEKAGGSLRAMRSIEEGIADYLSYLRQD